ncbi:hypothetical protein [Nocardia crassostreae]|uniref:hypothetical protein n=1 Tax=Nocardia crassostreae TaxID=53428 RepID=UPI000A9C3426|nr:hypothetical protein [Nocardia crassostreae]
MSRTDNTMPYRIQVRDGKTMFTRGGAYRGIRKEAKVFERRARQRKRLALHKGVEVEPTRHRHGAKWNYY